MSNVAKVAHVSLLNARQCLERKNYGRAFANFLVFLKLRPESCHEVYSEFGLVTKEWCEQLELQNRLEDLFKIYDQACELFPNHDVVLNNIGAQLFRLGYVEEAAAYIRKSLQVNPDYLAARNNLENICSHLVERWHFSMLNDRRRNVAFKFAIDKAIKSGYNTVLDIGTGTGILSLMSVVSGAVQVTACDSSRAMVDVARDVLQTNEAVHSVALLHKHSTDLRIPADISSRVKLVVTETFDAGLFGEHIVSTLTHAWKNLISTSPLGTVIPCGATMYVCGIECETIRKQTRFLYPVLQHLDMTGVELLCSTGHVAEEPYTTESLAKIHGGYKLLTNIAELLRVDFCNLYELDSIQKGRDWLCDLYVRHPGRLDAVAVWFDLHLDDTISIATGPDSEGCWEQAIFPVATVSRKSFNGCDKCHLRRLEKLYTTFHFEQDCLRLSQCQVVETRAAVGNVPGKCISRDVPMVKDVKSVKLPTPSGRGDQDCSLHCLPFRKRKVESVTKEVEVCTCDMKLSAENDVNDLNKKENHELEVTSNLQIPAATHCNKILELNAHTVPMDSQNVTLSNHSVHVPAGLSSTDVEMHIDMEKCSLDKTCDRFSVYQTEYCRSSVSGRTDAAVARNIKNVEHVDNLESSKLVHKSENKDSNDLPLTRLQVPKLSCFADQVDIEYVNDIQLNKHYCHALEQYRGQHSSRALTFLYITPRLSFLGIQAIKMGYKRVILVSAKEHHDTVRQVAALNGCKGGEITLMDLTDLNDLTVAADVIVSDVVEPCGALRQQALEDLVYHKLTSLDTSGLMLPAEVRVHGLFIESEELEKKSRVTGDDVTLGFQVAEFINDFEMRNHVNIDLTTLTYSKLTEVQELLSINIHEITMETANTTSDLDQTDEKSLEVMTSGKVTALVYWFELQLDKNTVISTLDSRYHWKQAAIMIKEDISVTMGQHLVTKVKLQNSCLDVNITDPHNSNSHI